MSEYMHKVLVIRLYLLNWDLIGLFRVLIDFSIFYHTVSKLENNYNSYLGNLASI